MNAESVMTRPVFTCSPHDMLNVPAQLMWDHNVGCVVVLEQGRIVGLITDRDVCMGAYTTGMPLWGIRVGHSMTRDPVTLREDASIGIAERVMREFGVRRLPIINRAGALVGLLSIDDIAREARRQWGRERAEVAADEVAETLAQVVETRRTDTLVAPKH